MFSPLISQNFSPRHSCTGIRQPREQLCIHYRASFRTQQRHRAWNFMGGARLASRQTESISITGSGRSCIKNSNTIQHCIRTVLLMNITFKQNMTTVSSRIRAWLCGAPQVRLTFAGIHPWAHWMFIRILVRTNPVGRALLYRGRSPNWKY